MDLKNLGEMLGNFKDLQKNMQNMQERMQTVTAEGSSGGGMVIVEINGQMEIKNIKIAPEVVDPSDIVMLQDLIKAAHTDAMVKIKDKLQQEMGGLGGGMPGFGV